MPEPAAPVEGPRNLGLTRALVVTLLCGLAAALWFGGLLTPLADTLRDARFSVAPRQATGRVVVVAIDSYSLSRVGIWPWPRDIHARLVSLLADFGAADIAFDVDFSSRSTSQGDDAFERALADADGKVLLAAMRSMRFDGAVEHKIIPMQRFADHAWLGLVDVFPDRDGVLRRFPAGAVVDGVRMPSMPVLLGGRVDPPQGGIGIDFSIRQETIERIKAADLLDGNVRADRIKGRKVIIGATAPELRDVFHVPTAVAMPGPVVQALATETLIQRREIRPAGPLAEAAALVALAVLALLVAPQLRLPAMLGCTAALAVAVEAAATAVQASRAVSADTSPLHLCLALFACAAVGSEVAGRRRLWLAARAQSRDLRALLDRVIDDNFTGILVVDRRGKVRAASRVAGEILRRPRDTLVDATADDVLPRDLRVAVSAMLATAVEPDRPETRAGETVVESHEGPRTLEYVATVSRLSSSETEAAGDANSVAVCLTFRDVTEEREAARRIDFLAHFDALTGLPNRHRFMADLARAVGTVRPADSGRAVLLADLDRFGWVNDALGQAAGDEVLREVARRIATGIGEAGTPARLGGDEFAALLSCPDAGALAVLAERLAATLAEPLDLSQVRGPMAISLGLASLVPGDTAGSALRRAHLALARAKSEGGSRFRIYDEELERASAERREIEQDLWDAVANERFELRYQPQFDLATREIIGAEALLRWTRPDKGPVSPAVFVPLAEEMGLIHQVGAWVLRKACSDAAHWPKPVRIAVNVSAAQVARGDLAETVTEVLAASGLDPERLELELTESLFLEADPGLGATLSDLRALGVGLALDDFGTGYSSLGYLKTFPFTKLKIDQSFVRDLPDHAGSATIVAALVTLARGLGLSVVAEGIETEEQRACLSTLGRITGQGYLFARPLPNARLTRLLAEPEDDRSPALRDAG
jgi:diguanylate cyclase (GGDEF)-like protein